MDWLVRDLQELREEIKNDADAIGELLKQWGEGEIRPHAAKVYYENLLSSLTGLTAALDAAIEAERDVEKME